MCVRVVTLYSAKHETIMGLAKENTTSKERLLAKKE